MTPETIRRPPRSCAAPRRSPRSGTASETVKRGTRFKKLAPLAGAYAPDPGVPAEKGRDRGPCADVDEAKDDEGGDLPYRPVSSS